MTLCEVIARSHLCCSNASCWNCVVSLQSCANAHGGCALFETTNEVVAERKREERAERRKEEKKKHLEDKKDHPEKPDAVDAVGAALLEQVVEISSPQSGAKPVGMDSESTQSEEAEVLDSLVSPKV